MDFPYWAVFLAVAATLAAQVLLLLVLSRGDFSRLGLGMRGLVRMLRDPGVADKVKLLLQPPPPEIPKPSRPSGVPLRFLNLLQREGRLVDFLTEDIQAYDDAQIGAAVREIHRQCRQALHEHLELEPVLSQEEGSTVEVPVGFDPSAIRLTGNLTGPPPFHGTLIHRGWRVKTIKLAAPAEGQDELILQPAEVELP
jgi:hypothetical protein